MRRSLREVIRRLAWSGVSLPVRAVVDRAYATPATGGYAADVEIVHRVTAARTGERLAEVPLQPLWLGGDGRGLFAPPAAGQHVMVSWIEGDRAHPFITGAAADRYTPAGSAAPGELALLDGRGQEIRLSDGLFEVLDGAGGELRLQRKWRLATAGDSLRPVLEALLDALIALTTAGPPGPHVASPATIAALQAVKQRLGTLLDP